MSLWELRQIVEGHVPAWTLFIIPIMVGAACAYVWLRGEK